MFAAGLAIDVRWRCKRLGGGIYGTRCFAGGELLETGQAGKAGLRLEFIYELLQGLGCFQLRDVGAVGWWGVFGCHDARCTVVEREKVKGELEHAGGVQMKTAANVLKDSVHDMVAAHTASGGLLFFAVYLSWLEACGVFRFGFAAVKHQDFLCPLGMEE